MAAYAASKWAAVGFSDSVRLELEQAGHQRVKRSPPCADLYRHRDVRRRQGILFTPMLKQEDVVEATWAAMLEGRPFVVMPWTSGMNKILTGVLPVRLRDLYLRRVGVYNSMDGSTGHRPRVVGATESYWAPSHSWDHARHPLIAGVPPVDSAIQDHRRQVVGLVAGDVEVGRHLVQRRGCAIFMASRVFGAVPVDTHAVAVSEFGRLGARGAFGSLGTTQ